MVNALNQIRAITETAGLLAFPKYGDRLSEQSLAEKCRNDPTIVQPHARSIRVENAHNPRLHSMLAVVGHGQRFGESFGFVVAATRPNGVDIPPIIFGLRMN